MTTPIAVARTMGEMIEAFRMRFEQLQVTHSEVDDKAGLPERYTNKIVNGKKNLGPLSFQNWCSTAGVMWLMVEDQEAMDRFTKKLVKSKSGAMLNIGRQSVVVVKLTRKRMQNLGKLSGKARMRKMKPSARRRVARIAARARWHKPRLVEIKGAAAKAAQDGSAEPVRGELCTDIVRQSLSRAQGSCQNLSSDVTAPKR